MSQLTRKLLNLFCANKVPAPTDNIGVFGSKKAGNASWSSDPDSIQSAHYLNGWNDAVVNNQAPCMDDMNAVQYLMSYMIKYLYQTGIPEWLSTEEYYQYALVQYNGSLWFSIYNGQNTDTPQTSSAKWSKLTFSFAWAAGKAYNVGDIVNYNGKTYKCVVGNTSNSIFETDFYAGDWDDGNPAGTLIHNIAWQKTTLPYHYFDVTGADAGAEVSQATYGALYSIIGNYYDNCTDYTTNTNYPTPSAGNFRLPDFRNTFFKNSGIRDWGSGHNATHTHFHNYTSSRSLSHNHSLYGWTPYTSVATVFPLRAKDSGYSGYVTWVTNEGANVGGKNTTNTTSLSIPALNLSTQGSGSTPEPNYYGTRILLKY
ncbi:MAG: hypothetical protein J5656_06685 [Clostridia bacterium]|nr:hypothetical protein [Clostridia bacterium]